MTKLKLIAAAALAAASLSASAMTSIADTDLSAIAGQDGVSIAANLNINIGSFTYTDTDATGGSVSFNGIHVNGMMAMTIDVLNAGAFQTAAVSAATSYSNAATGGLAVSGIAAALGYTGGDVVQFAFPAAITPAGAPAGSDAVAAAHAVSPTITIDSITTGNGGKSFGSVQIKNLDLQGTQVWMFGH